MTIEFNNESLVCIVGHRGSGKTFLAKALLRALAPRRLIVIDPLDQFSDFPLPVAWDLQGVLEHVKKGTLSFRLLSYSTSDAIGVMRLAYEIGNLTLALDEGDSILGPMRFECPRPFWQIVNYGRHLKISVVALAHRAVDLPRILTAQSTVLFSHAIDPNERKWFYARLGKQPPDLAQYEFCVSPLFGETAIIKAQDL